jgi:cobalamin biosynthesis Mg chelatase CobN
VTENGSPPDSTNTVGDRLAGDRYETPIRIAATAIGTAALVAGAVAVFETNNGAGTAGLLGVGLALLVIAAFGSRIVKLRGGGVEVELAQVAVRSAAAQLQVAATRAEFQGDDETAATFRAQAEAVLDLAQLAAPAANAYEQLRQTMESGYERTTRQQDIVDQAGMAARGRDHDPSEVRELFNSGKAGNRIYALGLMQADPRLRDFAPMLEAIRGSRSAFEQYTALRLAEEMVPDLSSDERRELRGTLEAERRKYITPGTDRWPISERILSKLGPASG